MAQFNEDCTNSYDHSSSNTEIACQQFANVVHESKSIVVSDDETQVLVFIAGYVGRKVKVTTNCLACVCELVTEKSMTYDVGTDQVIYTHASDRVGLTWST